MTDKERIAELEAKNKRLRDALDVFISIQEEYERKTGVDHPGNNYWSTYFMTVYNHAKEALKEAEDGR